MPACLLFALFAFSSPSLAATYYGFYFAGTKVTSDNCSNIPHNDNFGRGTATYDPTTKTLTLTNVTVDRSGSGHNAIDNESCDGLTVVCKGSCTLYSQDDYAIVVSRRGVEMNLQIEGTTFVESKNKSAIYSENDAEYEGYYNHTPIRISGSGTIYFDSQNSYAVEGNNSEFFFLDGITATLSGGKGALRNLYCISLTDGTEVTLKATNNSSYPIVSKSRLEDPSDMGSYLYDVWRDFSDHYWGSEERMADSIAANQEHRVPFLVQPWGATHDIKKGSVTYNGSDVYDKDIVITTRYKLLITKQFFPDANFRSYLASRYPKNYITESEVNACTKMDVSNRNISSLKGIKYFTKLQELTSIFNPLSELDLSANTELTKLYCLNSNLTSLSLNNMAKLTEINCSNNPLIDLKVTGCTALKTLNMTGCPSLKTINCWGNTALTSLGVANFKTLQTLDCHNNALTALDVSGCTALREVHCASNNLTSLSINDLPNLQTLDCKYNEELQYLDCQNNALTSLVFTGCPKLATVDAVNNKLQKISLWGCGSIDALYLNDNSLSNIDLSYCPKLIALDCDRNQLTTLDVSANPLLTSLYCRDNKLSQLDVSACSKLEYLKCTGNSLATLNLANCNSLRSVSCEDNKLTSLVVPQSPNLKTVYCHTNNIGSSYMKLLASSLPDRSAESESGKVYFLYPSSNEKNVYNQEGIDDAWKKNWQICWYNDGWLPYDDSTGIPGAEATADDDASPRYNLSGWRVDGNYKGITVQKGKKTLR